MPTTSPDNFPYPDNNSDASINVHIAALAGAVQAKVGPYILDTGWVDCPLRPGTSQQGGSLPQVRRIGKTVYIRWGVSGTGKAANTNSQVFTIPTGFRPATSSYVTVASSNGNASALGVIHPSGIVDLRTSASTGSYYMWDGATYLID